MTVKIDFKTNDAAFEDPDEVSRILREISQHIDAGVMADGIHEFKPSYKHRCEDPECRCYSEPLVDRGYGYPVCPSQEWRSERYPSLKNKPMGEYFINGD